MGGSSRTGRVPPPPTTPEAGRCGCRTWRGPRAAAGPLPRVVARSRRSPAWSRLRRSSSGDHARHRPSDPAASTGRGGRGCASGDRPRTARSNGRTRPPPRSPQHWRVPSAPSHRHSARLCGERPGGGGSELAKADDGPRTRDLWLGKPTLYQLSYVREGLAILAPGRARAGSREGASIVRLAPCGGFSHPFRSRSSASSWPSLRCSPTGSPATSRTAASRRRYSGVSVRRRPSSCSRACPAKARSRSRTIAARSSSSTSGPRGASPAARSRRCSSAGTSASRSGAPPSSESTPSTRSALPAPSSTGTDSPTRCSATAKAPRARPTASLASPRPSRSTARAESPPWPAARWTTSSCASGWCRCCAKRRDGHGGRGAMRAALMRPAVLALAAALALLLVPAPAPAQDCPKTTLGDIEDEVMCPICGTPLGLAAEAPQAQQQRAFIEEQIAACRSKEEIKSALVAQFGEGVLALPGDESGEDDIGDVLVYAIPAAAILLALGAIAFAVVRWRGGPKRPRPGSPAPAGSDTSRLDADLERYDL